MCGRFSRKEIVMGKEIVMERVSVVSADSERFLWFNNEESYCWKVSSDDLYLTRKGNWVRYSCNGVCELVSPVDAIVFMLPLVVDTVCGLQVQLRESVDEIVLGLCRRSLVDFSGSCMQLDALRLIVGRVLSGEL